MKNAANPNRVAARYDHGALASTGIVPNRQPGDKSAHACARLETLLAELELEQVAVYRAALADAMLCRLAVFSADPAFRHLADALARDTGRDTADAARLLHPVCQRVYRAACAAAEVSHA